MQFASEIQKLLPYRKTGYSPFKAETNRGVTNYVMFAYSVLSFFFLSFFLSFYDFNLNTQGFAYL